MRRTAAAVGVAAALIACAQIWGFEDLKLGDGGTPGMDGMMMGDASCGTQWPAPPAGDDPNGRLDAGGENGFIVIVSSFNVLKDTNGMPAKFGYDLDCLVTTGPNNSSCVVPPNAVSNIADQAGGIDNNGAPALGSLAALGTVIKDQLFNDSIQKGRASVMLRLYDYNGADDDTSVTFGVLGSVGTAPDPDGGQPVPNLVDGGDKWQIEIADVIPQSYYGPRTRATKAWVSKRTLVALFDNPLTISIPTQYGKIKVMVQSAVLTAKLVPAPGDTLVMQNGLIVGRWKTETLFNAVGNLTIQGMPLCGAVHSLADGICAYVDIASNKADDNKGKPCNALSVAMEFQAVPAIPSGLVDGGAYVDMCEAGDCPP